MKYNEIPYSVKDKELHDALKEVPLCQGEIDYSNYISHPCIVYTKDKQTALAYWDSMNQQWFSVMNHKVENLDVSMWMFYNIDVLWKSVDAIIEEYNKNFELNLARIACNL